jgi:hypothetical protein
VEGEQVRVALAEASAAALRGKAREVLGRLKSTGLATMESESVAGLSSSSLARIECGKEPSAATVSLLVAEQKTLEQFRTYWRLQAILPVKTERSAQFASFASRSFIRGIALPSVGRFEDQLDAVYCPV